MTQEVENEESTILETFSKPREEDEVDKGISVNNQLLIWDMLLETRIKMQKLLVNINKLPQFDAWLQFKENELGFEETAEHAVKELCNLFNSFTQLWEFVKIGDNVKGNEDDDIHSEVDDEQIANGVPNETDIIKKNGKRLKCSECDNEASLLHKRIKNVRDGVINEWYERTRYASTSKTNKGSLDMFEQSTVKAIEQVLLNRKRLIKRTQLKRSLYEIIGKSETKDNHNGEDDDNVESESYDSEVFDDDDFYHQLLRELIESKTEKAADPIALSQKWLQIQRIRSKLKRKVDTKASKGRKIRYDVHSKLINFMAPCDELKFTDDAKNELFASLFGKRKYLCEQ